MATDADGDISRVIEEAGELGLTVHGLTLVEIRRPAGSLRMVFMLRWLADVDRAGYFEYDSYLVPFSGSVDTHDIFKFWFTNPNTAMEFKIAFA